MAERLKAYGGCFDGTTLQVVAAKSQAEAAKLLEISVYTLREFGGECSGDDEIEIALSKPRTVFSSPNDPGRPHFIEGNVRFHRKRPWPPIPQDKGKTDG